MTGPPKIKPSSDRIAHQEYSCCSAAPEKSLQLCPLPVNLEADFFTASLALDSMLCAELSRRCRRELRITNGSWRADETYLRVAGKWTYLYRAVDSTGDTIDFLLSPKREASAAKRFFQKALRSPNHPRPRVINVDRNPAYPRAIDELKRTRELGQRCRCRPVRYLNNVEQDHRANKRRVRAMQGFRSFDSACRTIQGIETVNMIRKGQIR